MDFCRKSYQKHAEHMGRDLADPKRRLVHESWFREDTADFWRHRRIYEAVDCFTIQPQASWLTIGDGRYGLDSIRLRKKGFQDVLPTDISEHMLKCARERGLIQTYAVENAECLSFGDNAFDYVFCKESYHHFPRPMLALYEMLRVARRAVVLVEPHDWRRTLRTKRRLHPRGLGRGMAAAARCVGRPLLAKRPQLPAVPNKPPAPTRCIRGDYEESGNYVYRLSPRELTKVALALNLPAVAFRRFNDMYVKGSEFQLASWRSPAYRRMRATIFVRDLLAKLRLSQYRHVMAIVFKDAVDPGVLSVLKQKGWEVLDLPRNPHV